MSSSNSGLWRRWLLPALALVLALTSPASAVDALNAETAQKLTEPQREAYQEWRAWRVAFDEILAAYWSEVNAKRDERKKKHAARVPFTVDDYVRAQPPKYRGPALAPEITKIIAASEPPVPDKPMPGVPDFLAQAKAVYGFVPEVVTEAEFKRRYASEALALGLSRDQVVRVYALETGGDGTFDMQAGVSPTSKQGRPISSALGYAQLLSANTSDQLVRHGAAFIKRLGALGVAPGITSQRAQSLRAKAAALRRMPKAVRAVPDVWSEHVKFGTTPEGLGIHALNLDADIGPWLQVLKLRGLLETAAKEAARTELSGAELELMNLAGPRTGLEMLQTVGRTMPTANFFSQGGYYRNTIVREKTGAELLVALDLRMQPGLKRPGALEFARAFEIATPTPPRR